MEMQTHYSWKHLSEREGDYPELYILHTNNGDRIKIETHRKNRMVRLTVNNRVGEHIQSIICNGNILREKDLNSGKYLNLNDYFRDLNVDISSLPDNQILRIIGGNYGILTKFIGKVQRLNIAQRTKSNWQELIKFLFKYPKLITNFFKTMFASMFTLPHWWDLVDGLMIGSASFYIYSINFNFLTTGLFACSTALSSGVIDWLLRKRAPYVLKILLFFIPGIFIFYVGYKFQ